MKIPGVQTNPSGLDNHCGEADHYKKCKKNYLYLNLEIFCNHFYFV